MSDRARALDVLRRARDLLSQRLTEQILESEERIIDDASGDSYLGDIETLYDRFGSKLSHLTQMINGLPLEADEPVMASGYSSSSFTNYDAAEAATAEEIISPQTHAISGPLIVSAPALPAPRIDELLELAMPSFPLFLEQVREENLVDAGKTLGALFDISEARGVQCARVFYTRLGIEEALPAKAMQLRREVSAGGYNNALMLMAECFGIIGIEALGILQTMRSRWEPAN